jgi:hypothetical protein
MVLKDWFTNSQSVFWWWSVMANMWYRVQLCWEIDLAWSWCICGGKGESMSSLLAGWMMRAWSVERAWFSIYYKISNLEHVYACTDSTVAFLCKTRTYNFLNFATVNYEVWYIPRNSLKIYSGRVGCSRSYSAVVRSKNDMREFVQTPLYTMQNVVPKFSDTSGNLS